MATVAKRIYKSNGRTRKTAKYYGYLRGRPVALATDKQAAETMLAEMKRRIEREGHILDAAILTAPIATHLADYRAHLERNNRSESHVYVTMLRLEKLAKVCEWRTIQGVTPASVERWIDAAKRGKTADRTINHFIATVKTFLEWARRSGRVYQNKLKDFAPLDATELKRIRRALTLDEIERLLNTTPEPRKMIYWTALATGLRRGELVALQWGDVRIDDVPAPFIQLRAKATKAKRADVIPLRGDLADALLAARPKGYMDDDRVFKIVPRNRVFKIDLKAAGIAEKDRHGRWADIHALRHSYCTHLAAVGVNPREAMGLMRHTDIRLTAKTYTDDALLPLREAVEKLPTFAPRDAESERQAARANGTDGKSEPVSTLGNLRGDEGRKGGKAIPGDTFVPDVTLAVSGMKRSDLHKGGAIDTAPEKLGALGLEPRTHGLKGRCSTD